MQLTTPVAVGSTYLANLKTEIELPKKGVFTRVIQNDEHVRVTAFGFAPGEEISTHSSPRPALLYFLEGEADVQLDREIRSVREGNSVTVEPFMLHGLAAKSPVRMVRVQVKRAGGDYLRSSVCCAVPAS